MSFVEDVDRELEGIKFFSVGACPTCDSCGPFDQDDLEAYDMANEGHFSWSACDSCGSTLGGDRHAAHGFIGDDLHHFDVCVDCLFYHANGDVPEPTR